MVRIALIGSGMIGQVHARAYAQIEGVRIACVVDKNRDAGERLAQDLNCAYVDEVSKLRDHPFDIADICLPTHLHVPIIEAVSGMCKNIVCEKPLALHLEEVDKVQRIVERDGIKLMVAHVLRFWNAYVRCKEIVDSGALGRLNSIVCTRRQPPPNWSNGNWLFNISQSGGLVFDLLAHDVDYITWLLGAPEYVMGKVSQTPSGAQTHAKAELIYDGYTATVFGSWGMPSCYGDGKLSWTLEIIGEGGLICAGSASDKLLINIQGQRERTELLPEQDPYAEELRYFVDCVRQNRAPSRTDAYSVKQPLQVLQAIVRSSETNRLINMKEQ